MPARNTRSNVPVRALRWSVERASGEFKLAANTLRKILNQSGAEPDQTGCFSTMQLVNAIFGDLRSERLRKERELVKKYSIENRIAEASLLDRRELMRTFTFTLIADAMVNRIMTSELSRAAKEDILRDLSSWPDAIKEVASRQSRLPRSRRDDGQEDNDDDDAL
jgi:hypothetical protein